MLSTIAGKFRILAMNLYNKGIPVAGWYARFCTLKRILLKLVKPSGCNIVPFNYRFRHDYKCLFVHIPRTGGTSITDALMDLPERPLPEPQATWNLNYFRHAKAHEIRAAIGARAWQNVFTFAFVRNPWDLMASVYNWWLQKAYQWDYYQPNIQAIQAMKGFDAFIRSPYGTQQINQFRGNLYDWIAHDGKIIVNYVGRFETMQDDWNEICRRIGAEPTTLPHFNDSKRNDYRRYYTDETQRIIEKRFRKTIELYGYDF